MRLARRSCLTVFLPYWSEIFPQSVELDIMPTKTTCGYKESVCQHRVQQRQRTTTKATGDVMPPAADDSKTGDKPWSKRFFGKFHQVMKKLN